MADRILYVPVPEADSASAGVPDTGEPRLVAEKPISFVWQGWQTPEEKRANVAALHEEAARLGIAPVLDISTKSLCPLGRRLSPFNLRCSLDLEGQQIQTSFESLWNGSKIFENGGPFPALYALPPWESLKDPRNSSRVNGRILGVRVEGETYPQRAGYDFLYISTAASEMTEADWEELSTFQGFTEITLNPAHSRTCQANSAALMAELKRRGLLGDALESFARFQECVTTYDPQRYAPPPEKPSLPKKSARKKDAPSSQLSLF